MRKVVPLLLIAGATIFFLRDQLGILREKIKVNFKSIGFNNRETEKSFFTRLFFNLHLSVFNPSDLEGTIKAIQLDFIFNKKIVSSLSGHGAINLIPKKDNDLTLLVGLNTLAIVPTLTEAFILIKNRRSLSIQIVGTITTDAGIVVINEVQNFSL